MTYMRNLKLPCRWPVVLILALLLPLSIQAEQRRDPPIEIDSEAGGIDARTGAYWMRDNIRIKRGQLKVRADEGRSFTNDEGQVTRIELSGSPTTWQDVLEDGSDVNGRSREIVYDFLANTITMIGDAHIQNIQGAFSGSKLVYDLATQNLVGDGGVRLVIEPPSGQSSRQPTPPEDSDPEPDDSGEPDDSNESEDR